MEIFRDFKIHLSKLEEFLNAFASASVGGDWDYLTDRSTGPPQSERLYLLSLNQIS
jgi:hypothetical protein